MKKTSLFVFAALIVLSCFTGCEKPAGEGGNSTITGQVWIKEPPLYNEYAGADREVYIIYGDDLGAGDRIRANYDGIFEFKYLRKGTYKLYVYSKKLTSSNQDSAVIATVEIKKNKETVTVPKMIIYDY